jgi:hypothetical protein
VKEIKFQYYKNDVESSKPSGYVGLVRFLSIIKNPKKSIKDLLEKIQEASKAGDVKLKTKLKEGLHGFTPCVNVSERRKYDFVTSYTGLAVLDFDKIENAHNLKHWIFNNFKFIIAAWISPSGKGCKALVKIPIVESKADFKSYTFGLCTEFKLINGFDIVVNNAVLLTFVGYDPDILIRTNAITFQKRGIQIDSFDSKPIKDFVRPDTLTSGQTKWVTDWYENSINSINGNGHPQLRDHSVSLGGYVGGGYLSQMDAESLAESLIHSNGYLQKGISGYIKTAKQAINLGMSKPLTFDSNK